MTKPDFDKWASVICTYRKNESGSLEVSVAEGLKQAFEQGWSVGYMDGADNDWWKKQEEER